MDDYQHPPPSTPLPYTPLPMPYLISNQYTTLSAITYNQFQLLYHTVHTSPTTSSNQYTTPSTHHLQPVPTSIPHCPHITYNQFQLVYHTVHTSPTTNSNQHSTPSTHHLQAALKLTSPQPVSLRTLNNCISQYFSNYPLLTYLPITYTILTKITILTAMQ